MNKSILIIFFVLLRVYCFGQSPKEQLEIANAAKASLTDFYEEVPFIDRAGYYIIPVTIGAQTYDYIFDTGGYNTVTSDIMSKNGLAELMKVAVGSSNQVKSKISLSKIPRLSVGDIPFTDVGVFNFDFDDSPVIKCYTNGGLLGKGVIRQSVWQIDYPNKIMRLADNVNKMPNLENSVKLKVELDRVLNPFIQIEIDGRNQKFMLDFGYGGFISLTEKTANEYQFANSIETYGEGTIGANGVKKESMYVSRLKTVKVAGQSIANQVAFYSQSNNYNLIGSDLAKHFIVTLNFQENELLLTPHSETAIDQFNSFGVDMNTNGNEIYVNRLYKGLSAEVNGIKLNDILVSLNNFSVDKQNLCDSYFKIREILNQTDSLNMKVMRNNEEMEFILTKKHMN
jgi:predicted aspartyl protease